MILCEAHTMSGMTTRKLSISLPEEVAKILDEVDNASAYIAEAIRLRRKRDSLVNLFAAEGITVTAEGVAAAKERFGVHLARRAKTGHASEGTVE